jgi:aminopeptidase-like protein
LYPQIGEPKSRTEELIMRLHLLTWADGKHDLLSIAGKMNKSALEFEKTVTTLVEKGLIS